MKTENKENILIIGGDSFIAKKFIAHYKEIFQIKSVSRIATSYSEEIVREDLFSLAESVFFGVDVVINFAAIVHQPGLKEESVYRKVNYELPLFLAEMAQKANVKQFIQMSTIAVYGEVEGIDNQTKTAPVNLYGKYKLLTDEELINRFNAIMDISIIRPSMVYGGGKAPGNLQKLITLINTGLPLPFKGIENSRQFTHIENLIAAFASIINHNHTGIIVLADEVGISTSELIRLIAKSQNKNVKQIKAKLFWAVLKKIKPSLVHKLISDLKIKNSFSYAHMGIERALSIHHEFTEK